MRAVPFPSRFNDRVDAIVLGNPVQKFLSPSVICDQLCWITGAAMTHHGRDRVPRNFPAGLNDFLNTRPAARAQVCTDPLAWLNQLKRADMGAGKIIYVNVVAQSCSIVCRKIITENGDLISLPQGDLQDDWNQV